MGRTVWYPGHMAKGKRQLEALAKNIDLLIEVRDARAPSLTSSPLLNLFAPKIQLMVVLSKADLADDKITQLWTESLKKKGFLTWPLDLRKGGMSKVKKTLSEKKPQFRDLRMAVVGTPNVGKSMLINQLVGRKAAPVGGIPGITKGVSWFKGQGYLLVDSPGILDPHSDSRAHRLISWIGSSRSQVIGNWEEHAKDCMTFMIKKNLWSGVERSWGIAEDTDTSLLLEKVACRLGRILPGNKPDLEGAGKAFLDAFATGKLGKMSFEKPGDAPLWESL
ncbi:MAG: GTPase [Synergistaceae bacterium]